MKEHLKTIFDECVENNGNVISILQGIEKTFGYIPEDAVAWFAKKLDIPASRFFGIATFYSQFHLTPRGGCIISICRGTACHVKGSEKLLDRLSVELGLPPGNDSTSDLRFTIEKVNCIGACGIAPVAIVHGAVLGNSTLMMIMKEISELKASE